MAEPENLVAEPALAYLPMQVRPRLMQNSREGSSSPEPNCSICLGRLENTSYTDSCLHQFCFSCILTWSKIKRECPLCKQNFNSIIHNVRSENDYDQCQVEAIQNAHNIIPDRPNWLPTEMPATISRYGWSNQNWNEFFRQRMHRMQNTPPLHIPLPERRSLHFRRRVYRELLYSSLLRNRTGLPRESSPTFYRNNPAELRRLLPFIRRELHAIFCTTLNFPLNTTVDAIMDILKTCSIRSWPFVNHCNAYMSDAETYIFRHELWNFAISGYDVVGYDLHVKYYPKEVVEILPRLNTRRRNYWTNDLPVAYRTDNDIRVVQEVQAIREAPFRPPPWDIPDIIEDLTPIFETNLVPRERVVDVVNLTFSDSSSSSDECEIINVVRPEDRVFEVVDLSSDSDEVIEIEISQSSSMSSFDSTETANTRGEEEENKSQITLSFNLPSTSYQNNDTPEHSYTPPLPNSDSSTDSATKNSCSVKLYLKRSRSSSADADSDSDSSMSSIRNRTRERKRRKMGFKRRYYYESSLDSCSESDDDSDSSYHSKHRAAKSRRSSSSSDSSSSDDRYKSRTRSSSTDSDKKGRKRRSKKSKRRRNSSSSRKEHKSKEKKSKKHKKHRESRHRKSDKKEKIRNTH